MPRPIMDLRARFASEITIWDTALANGGTIWYAEDANDAIRITMRLNIYRKNLRSMNPLIQEDRYVVARDGAVITIRERAPIRGYGTRLDGTPLLSPAEAAQRIVAGDIAPDEPLGLDIADD